MADEGLTLSQVLRHAADLLDEVESGQLGEDQVRYRVDYLVNTMGIVRVHVDEMWNRVHGAQT